MFAVLLATAPWDDLSQAMGPKVPTMLAEEFTDMAN